MSDKLNCIMLVDDNEADNYLHRLIIEEMGCCEQVVDRPNGKAALDYLDQTSASERYPDLILLDINMPIMNGWEFLEEYRHQQANHRDSVIIVMLSTSLNPDDRARALGNPLLASFVAKPLEEKQLGEILRDHFRRAG